jgi:hypothetical protein
MLWLHICVAVGRKVTYHGGLVQSEHAVACRSAPFGINETALNIYSLLFKCRKWKLWEYSVSKPFMLMIILSFLLMKKTQDRQPEDWESNVGLNVNN